MIVVDTSALLEVFVGRQPDAALVLLVATDELHAPHLIDIEMLNALRGWLKRTAASIAKVEAARAALQDLQVTRYPHNGLRDRVWELRHNLSAYDACYVALAEVLGAPLVTTNGRIARAPGVRTRVEVFPRSG